MILPTGTPSSLPLNDSTVLAADVAQPKYNSLALFWCLDSPRTKRIKEFIDVHIKLPHQLNLFVETSSHYIFGNGIDITHGIPQCTLTAILLHGPRTGLPKGSNASGSCRVMILGMSLLRVSIPTKKHPRCCPWVCNRILALNLSFL